jgi:hypothetical protein
MSGSTAMGEYIQGSIEISLINNAPVHSAKNKSIMQLAAVGWRSQSQASSTVRSTKQRAAAASWVMTDHGRHGSWATRCAAARVMHAGHGSTIDNTSPSCHAAMSRSRWTAAQPHPGATPFRRYQEQARTAISPLTAMICQAITPGGILISTVDCRLLCGWCSSSRGFSLGRSGL